MSLHVIVLAILATFTDPASSQSITAHLSSAASVRVQTVIIGLGSASLGGIAASVVSADPCRTTLAMQCTDENICANALGLQMNVTHGLSHYEVAYSTSMSGGGFKASQACSLSSSEFCVSEAPPVSGYSRGYCLGTTITTDGLACSANAAIAVQGQSTYASTTVRAVIGTYTYVQIPITAGAEKLPLVEAICTPTQATSDAVFNHVVSMPGVVAAVSLLVLGHMLGQVF